MGFFKLKHIISMNLSNNYQLKIKKKSFLIIIYKFKSINNENKYKKCIRKPRKSLLVDEPSCKT